MISDNYWIEEEHYDIMETEDTFEFIVKRDPEGMLREHTLGKDSNNNDTTVLIMFQQIGYDASLIP